MSKVINSPQDSTTPTTPVVVTPEDVEAAIRVLHAFAEEQLALDGDLPDRLDEALNAAYPVWEREMADKYGDYDEGEHITGEAPYHLL